MSCTHCSAAIPQNSAFCPACGTAVANATPPLGVTGGLSDNVAGALAYFTFIPAIIFLVAEPFNRNRFIRFHSFQCLFMAAAGFVLGVALKISFIVLFLIPLIGPLVSVLLSVVVGLGAFLLWIVVTLKAYQGVMFKVPYLGDMAEKQSSIGVQ